MIVSRTNVILRPDSSRVMFRAFNPADSQRAVRIIARVMALSDAQVERALTEVLDHFRGRHHRLLPFFLKRFAHVREGMLTDQKIDDNRRHLIGAYFTQEYSLESAALFNPSLIWHPDQSKAPPGGKRFILSLRATGEGHISSIVFRSGTIDEQNHIQIDEPSRFVTVPDVEPNSLYEKPLFERKLTELGLANEFVMLLMSNLEETFTLGQLQDISRDLLRQYRPRASEWEPTLHSILHLARSNYEVFYSQFQDLSERVIFPFAPSETNGIEDARFVEFREEDGQTTYYATYTAYDGRVTLPQLLETRDFVRFKISTLNGPEVRNKGFAIFPRRINGHYAMISRQDGENMSIMFSDMLHFWYTRDVLIKPTFPWEFVQVGNCGSPIETDAGWLVITHGVGPMRRYTMGAILLDRDNPTRVIARMTEPILVPNDNEREGYVPNVVYSCGGQLHGDTLIIPYAMSDQASTFGMVSLDALLGAMTRA